MKTGKLKNDKKNHLDWMAVLMAIVFPAKYTFIPAVVFYLLYIASDKVIFIILIGLTALAYLVAVVLLIRYFRKGSKSSKPPASPSKSSVHKSTDAYDEHHTGEDVAAAFAAGMIGGALMHRLFKDW